MTFSNLGDLKARVLSDTLRTGDTGFIGEFPGFVRLAEQRMWFGMDTERVRVRDMDATSIIIINSAGNGTLPDRYLEALSAIWSAGTSSDEMTFAAPRDLHLRRAIGPGSSEKPIYAIEGNSLMVWPSRSGSVVLSYARAYEPLVADADTNWLLQNAPGVYFYSILTEAYRYLRDTAKQAESYADFQRAVRGVKSTSYRGRNAPTSHARTSAFA